MKSWVEGVACQIFISTVENSLFAWWFLFLSIQFVRFHFHGSWPPLGRSDKVQDMFVAVMGKVEGQGESWHGHVTAVTVASEYRRQQLAKKLMHLLEDISEKFVYCLIFYFTCWKFNLKWAFLIMITEVRLRCCIWLPVTLHYHVFQCSCAFVIPSQLFNMLLCATLFKIEAQWKGHWCICYAMGHV